MPDISLRLDFTSWPEVMTSGDIVACAGLSRDQALEILKDHKLHRLFPDDRRCMIVGKYALRDFLNGRAVTN
jgi:hypothetical protein